MSQDSDRFDEDYVAEEDEDADPADEGYTTGGKSIIWLLSRCTVHMLSCIQ
jgi:hypothetical protein